MTKKEAQLSTDRMKVAFQKESK